MCSSWGLKMHMKAVFGWALAPPRPPASIVDPVQRPIPVATKIMHKLSAHSLGINRAEQVTCSKLLSPEALFLVESAPQAVWPKTSFLSDDIMQLLRISLPIQASSNSDHF